MAMPATQMIFPAIESGDLEAIRRLLDEDPGHVHVRHADAELHHWTALQFAAAKGQLAACRLLVDRGAEVYTNPMRSIATAVSRSTGQASTRRPRFACCWIAEPP